MRGLGRHKIFNLIYEESKNMKRTVDTRGKNKNKRAMVWRRRRNDYDRVIYIHVWKIFTDLISYLDNDYDYVIVLSWIVFNHMLKYYSILEY